MNFSMTVNLQCSLGDISLGNTLHCPRSTRCCMIVQMYAYVIDPALPWGNPSLQQGWGFILLHLPHDASGIGTTEMVFYWVTAALITVMILLAGITCREMIM